MERSKKAPVRRPEVGAMTRRGDGGAESFVLVFLVSSLNENARKSHRVHLCVGKRPVGWCAR